MEDVRACDRVRVDGEKLADRTAWSSIEEEKGVCFYDRSERSSNDAYVKLKSQYNSSLDVEVLCSLLSAPTSSSSVSKTIVCLYYQQHGEFACFRS